MRDDGRPPQSRPVGGGPTIGRPPQRKDAEARRTFLGGVVVVKEQPPGPSIVQDGVVAGSSSRAAPFENEAAAAGQERYAGFLHKGTIR